MKQNDLIKIIIKDLEDGLDKSLQHIYFYYDKEKVYFSYGEIITGDSYIGRLSLRKFYENKELFIKDLENLLSNY